MKLNDIDEVWNRANFTFFKSKLKRDVFGLLSSKSFATMATWRNDFSSLLIKMGLANPISQLCNGQKGGKSHVSKISLWFYFSLVKKHSTEFISQSQSYPFFSFLFAFFAMICFLPWRGSLLAGLFMKFGESKKGAVKNAWLQLTNQNTIWK